MENSQFVTSSYCLGLAEGGGESSSQVVISLSLLTFSVPLKSHLYLGDLLEQMMTPLAVFEGSLSKESTSSLFPQKNTCKATSSPRLKLVMTFIQTLRNLRKCPFSKHSGL